MTRRRKPTSSLVRSSAAEHLTFVAVSGEGGVEADSGGLKLIHLGAVKLIHPKLDCQPTSTSPSSPCCRPPERA